MTYTIDNNKVYTSYYAKACREFPSHRLLSISLGTPSGFTGNFVRELNPTENLLISYKSNKITWEEYEEIYEKDILSNLNAKEIYEKCKGRILLCYCGDFEHCHRKLVLNWLRKNLGDSIIGGEISYNKPKT